MKIISYILIVLLLGVLLNSKLNIINTYGYDNIIKIVIVAALALRLTLIVIKKNKEMKNHS